MKPQERKLRADHIIVALLLFIMALIAFINVLSRYIFHFSFACTEEITINLFVWMTVIGTGLAFEQGGQLGMVTLFNLFPKKMKQSLIIFSSLLAALLFVVVDFYMIKAIYYELTIFNATSAALGIPVWIYYAGVPLCSIFVFTGIYRDNMKKLADISKE